METNRAHLKGYEDDVGTKTTFYTAYPESIMMSDIEDIENAYLLEPLFTNYMVSWLEMFVNGSIPTMAESLRGGPRRYSNNGSFIQPQNVRIIHPDIIRHFQVNFLNSRTGYPSTGAIIIIAAMHMCDQVKVYGFGRHGNSSLHYYDSADVGKYVSRTNHNFLNEWEVWSKLQDYGVLSFYQPES
ncbi:alpha-N-acetylgalactosaminide alpha-2,6-sialyltransferase 1-like [Saccoglossus kowalevskii]